MILDSLAACICTPSIRLDESARIVMRCVLLLKIAGYFGVDPLGAGKGKVVGEAALQC